MPCRQWAEIKKEEETELETTCSSGPSEVDTSGKCPVLHKLQKLVGIFQFILPAFIYVIRFSASFDFFCFLFSECLHQNIHFKAFLHIKKNIL